VALAVAGFFLLFAAPSMALAVLALREFLLRSQGVLEIRLRRAARLLLVAAALPPALVVVTVLATGGAPFATQGGWVFVGYGLAAGALGPVGAWLFRRAAAVPLRATIKAAETVPLLLVLMNLVLVYNAAVQG
jgi:hypothetical protein